LAQAIRSAARAADGKRKQMLFDRAVLIVLAESVDEVLMLLDEVERLGVQVRRR
jgi:hypothetical protein